MLFADGTMHTPLHLPTELAQLARYPRSLCFALDDEAPPPGVAAVMGEPEEVERLRPTVTAAKPGRRCEPAKLDQPRLFLM
jgi:hypothetical protein